MTEQEWLASNNPVAMLRLLGGEVTWRASEPKPVIPPASDRKLRLFAAACYRDVAEAARPFADADKAADEAEFWAEQGHAAPGVRESSIPVDTHDRAIDHAIGAATWAHCHRGSRTLEQLATTQAALLRTIVGNPWRPVSLVYSSRTRNVDGSITHHDCPWLTHADGRVPKLAQVIYDERRWELMPMLADALEEAGCHEEEILRWCRGQERCPDCFTSDEPGWRHCHGENDPGYYACRRCDEADEGRRGTGWIPRRGPSVRGDWVLDLLLGKE